MPYSINCRTLTCKQRLPYYNKLDLIQYNIVNMQVDFMCIEKVRYFHEKIQLCKAEIKHENRKRNVTSLWNNVYNSSWVNIVNMGVFAVSMLVNGDREQSVCMIRQARGSLAVLNTAIRRQSGLWMPLGDWQNASSLPLILNWPPHLPLSPQRGLAQHEGAQALSGKKPQLRTLPEQQKQLHRLLIAHMQVHWKCTSVSMYT